MKNVMLFLIFLSSSTLIFSGQIGTAQIIDFKTIETYPNRLIDLSDAQRMGESAFNKSPEIGTFVAHLKEKYQLNVAIETGTRVGKTTAFLASLFNKVNTIELNPGNYYKAKKFLHSFPNVVCHLGSSGNILPKILSSLKNEHILFYLDAHGQNDWPILEELKVISKTHRDNCVIVIDDCKVPGRPEIFHDTWNGIDLCIELVQPHLNRIFKNYSVYYLIPRNIAGRAKLVVIPCD